MSEKTPITFFGVALQGTADAGDAALDSNRARAKPLGLSGRRRTPFCTLRRERGTMLPVDLEEA
jgi:hypothetical protein